MGLIALAILLILGLPILATILGAVALSRIKELRAEVVRLRSMVRDLQGPTVDRLEKIPRAEMKPVAQRPADDGEPAQVGESVDMEPVPQEPPDLAQQAAAIRASAGSRSPGGPGEERPAPIAPPDMEPPPSSSPPPVFATTSRQTRRQWPALKPIDWERFTGVRLFAWAGGLALFLGILFLVKYSIDQGLIGPAVRVGASLLLGTGCIVAGLRLFSGRYGTTAHALCAAGPAILYVDVYAAHHFYGFIGLPVAFLFMVLVTTVVFLLALRLGSRYVALLGLVGGFLTPPSLSTGVDQPLALFGYLALLDAGLLLIALRMGWGFLTPLAATATVLTQLGWTDRFFTVEKTETALAVQSLFSALFVGAASIAHFRRSSNRPTLHTGGAVPLFSLAMILWMTTFPEVAHRPGVVFSVVLALNLLLSGLVFLRSELGWAYLLGLSITFGTLLFWTLDQLTPSLLPWALAFYLAFGALHAVMAIVLKRRHPTFSPTLAGLAFPAVMLVTILSGVAGLDRVPLSVWPFVFLLDLVALGAALLTGILWLAGLMLILTLATLWLGISLLVGAGGLGELLLMTTLFSLGFLAVGLFLRLRPSLVGATSENPRSSPNPWERWLGPEGLPVLSALAPFVLLVAVFVNLDLVDPSPVFGLALLLTVLLLGMARYLGNGALCLAGLASVSLLEAVWHDAGFDPRQLHLTLPWYILFLLIHGLFPFIYQRHIDRHRSRLPWVASALAGPIHFFLIFDALPISRGQVLAGVLTLGFAACYLAGLLRLMGTTPVDHPQRSMRLSLFGAMSLFFVSLAFPIVFDKEWLTIGWALEGLALIWLYGRIAHVGLKRWALVLLGIAFVRLALNPAVLIYHAPTQVPVVNWYLYAYGTVIACLVLAAVWWRPRQERLAILPIPSSLHAMGAVLAFLLLNIEIADFFSRGTHLTFQFGSSLAQDMTYSLAWAAFSLALLVIGIVTGGRGARFSSLGLLAATSLKLFLYDLWRLGQLYRVGAFVGLAAMLILVSFLYQRYFGERLEGASPGVDAEKGEVKS